MMYMDVVAKNNEHEVCRSVKGKRRKYKCDEGKVLKQSGGKVNKDWILMDNCSTVNVFCNPKYLANIHPIQRKIWIHSTAEVSTANLVGKLPCFGQVWFYPKGLANILSLV